MIITTGVITIILREFIRSEQHINKRRHMQEIEETSVVLWYLDQ